MSLLSASNSSSKPRHCIHYQCHVLTQFSSWVIVWRKFLIVHHYSCQVIDWLSPLTEAINCRLKSWNFRWHVFTSTICWPVSEVYVETSYFVLVFRICWLPVAGVCVRRFMHFPWLRSGSIAEFSMRELPPWQFLICCGSDCVCHTLQFSLFSIMAIFFSFHYNGYKRPPRQVGKETPRLRNQELKN